MVITNYELREGLVQKSYSSSSPDGRSLLLCFFLILFTLTIEDVEINVYQNFREMV